eukprot:TRINITY_DN1117_c0_g1_i6.p2 TRINITY_DN1117_c0_g1~~TRINITY_DN1117_c0_g1_i6.p2  ORF type:complete len:102 (-),score=17.17 TRINITY_DN1117_c0_g1_i6:170-475(-)
MFIVESKNKWKVTRIECLWLDIPVEVCKERVHERKNHPTLGGGPEVDEVIDDFAKRFRTPEPREGFTNFMHAQSSEDVRRFVAELKGYSVGTGTKKGKAKK